VRVHGATAAGFRLRRVPITVAAASCPMAQAQKRACGLFYLGAARPLIHLLHVVPNSLNRPLQSSRLCRSTAWPMTPMTRLDKSTWPEMERFISLAAPGSMFEMSINRRAGFMPLAV
jgi:hypothetical protein